MKYVVRKIKFVKVRKENFRNLPYDIKTDEPEKKKIFFTKVIFHEIKRKPNWKERKKIVKHKYSVGIRTVK